MFSEFGPAELLGGDSLCGGRNEGRIVRRRERERCGWKMSDEVDSRHGIEKAAMENVLNRSHVLAAAN
jgi:hypothetical protein